jgi:hypothetical protein
LLRLALFALAVTATPALARTPAETLASAVKYNDVRKHLQELQQIADENGGNRGSITPGYQASVDYVASILRRAGYDVTIQQFTFEFVGETAPPEFERVSPNPETYQEGEDFFTMQYSGSGDVTARIRPVDVVVPIGSSPDNTSTSGCEPADFTNARFQPGEIALLQRGTSPEGRQGTHGASERGRDHERGSTGPAGSLRWNARPARSTGPSSGRATPSEPNSSSSTGVIRM